MPALRAMATDQRSFGRPERGASHGRGAPCGSRSSSPRLCQPPSGRSATVAVLRDEGVEPTRTGTGIFCHAVRVGAVRQALRRRGRSARALQVDMITQAGPALTGRSCWRPTPASSVVGHDEYWSHGRCGPQHGAHTSGAGGRLRPVRRRTSTGRLGSEDGGSDAGLLQDARRRMPDPGAPERA